ncbi:RepA protein [Rivihabitans pingtungensis]|uniref:RepA protein n=1 Tax=Rivihabitans pingtungensis TaxID=1054498 RepID=A0A318KGD9_9NEIS|nr:RepA protein [Rivihabitans pingtungensis]
MSHHTACKAKTLDESLDEFGRNPPAGEAAPKTKTSPTTRRDLKLIEASALIASEPPNGNDMAFNHAVLCQVGLPRSKVAGEKFMRQSGSAWVNVQAGYLDEGNGPVMQPIPYGAMPRLALAWVSTYAKRNHTREIPIGDSASEFLRLLGQPTTGGERGSFRTLRTQMHALAACRLQLGYKGRTYNGQPIEQFDAWQANKNTQQKALWPGVMLLSDGYFSELIANGVPLDNRALHALKGSALALDVYAWLAHRLYRIESRPVILHWKSLREQFAQEYQGKDADKDFKKKFVPALKAAQAVYPTAKVKQVMGGVMLLPSPPPIPFKGA